MAVLHPISQEDEVTEDEEEDDSGALEEEEEEEEEYAPHPDCISTILFTNRPTGGNT